MKMRWWIGVLLLLNGLALAWQWNAFARWGLGPDVQREPERLKQQIQPEALQIMPPAQDASAPASTAPQAPAKPAAPVTSPAPAAPAAPAQPVAPAPAVAPAKPASS
jgi:hypothetical protein